MDTIIHRPTGASTGAQDAIEAFDSVKAAVQKACPEARSFLPIGIMGARRQAGIVWQATDDPSGPWGYWCIGQDVDASRTVPTWYEAQRAVWARAHG